MGELNRDKGHFFGGSRENCKTRVSRSRSSHVSDFCVPRDQPVLSRLQTPQVGLTHTKFTMKAKTPAMARSGLFGDDFRTSKKDKRQIKHATLMSKIAKSSKTQKKRRPSKKLVANLESLADALPDAADEAHDAASQANVIKQKTLRHKPGALKRREKLEKVERDRFARNMAQMSGLQTQAADSAEVSAESNPTANRWSALRSFISQTMEQQPVFKTTK